MARVLAVFDDLLLGSNVLGLLQAGGHEARLAGPAAVEAQDWDLVIVDLGSASFDGVAVAAAAGADVKRLGIYSHVHPEQREPAEAAGFDLIVPRSRLMREGHALVARLLSPG